MSDEQAPHEIEVRHFYTAIEFWQQISPTAGWFSPMDRLIYRGQGDATWGLVPSILRPKARFVYSAALIRGHEESLHRIVAEVYYLESFVRYCDAAGYESPATRSNSESNPLSNVQCSAGSIILLYCGLSNSIVKS
jgi:hypothetical protein